MELAKRYTPNSWVVRPAGVGMETVAAEDALEHTLRTGLLQPCRFQSLQAKQPKQQV